MVINVLIVAILQPPRDESRGNHLADLGRRTSRARQVLIFSLHGHLELEQLYNYFFTGDYVDAASDLGAASEMFAKVSCLLVLGN